LISANIVLDSISDEGLRLTTFELTLPKTLLAQLNTHRALSKNAASARAIPTKKFKQSVIDTPFIPTWTMNKPGMVGERADTVTSDIATHLWLDTRDLLLQQMEKFEELGIHKQNINRLLEPFFYAKVVCSATDLEWFYFLRISGSAQEEIAQLARCMKAAQDASTPQLLQRGEWHVPYILGGEAHLDLETRLAISVARCARTSYKTHDDDKTSVLEKDMKLYQQLFEEKHLSPFEHQARVAFVDGYRNSNYNGWVQFRELMVP
jgi:hypothetical protein